MKNLIKILLNNNLTLSSAESLTGGLFGATITKYSGVSSIYKGGQIVYSNHAKLNLIKISEGEFNQFGAISSECANLLSSSILEQLNTDLAISFTGNAGPTAQDNEPVGKVYISVSYHKNHLVESKCQCFQMKGTRIKIQKQCIQEGIKMLLNIIERENIYGKRC